MRIPISEANEMTFLSGIYILAIPFERNNLWSFSDTNAFIPTNSNFYFRFFLA